MLNINEISDYRDLLKNYYTQRKLDMPLYSYKMMGQKLGLETSQIFRVLNKELHLPNHSIPLAKDMLDLKGRSGEIFEILVAASKAKSQAKKEKLYKMALSLQDVDLRKLSASEYLFLSKWWIPVVRALIEMNGGHAEVSRLVKQITPTVSEDQVVAYKDGCNPQLPKPAFGSGPKRIDCHRTFKTEYFVAAGGC